MEKIIHLGKIELLFFRHVASLHTKYPPAVSNASSNSEVISTFHVTSGAWSFASRINPRQLCSHDLLPLQVRLVVKIMKSQKFRGISTSNVVTSSSNLNFHRVVAKTAAFDALANLPANDNFIVCKPWNQQDPLFRRNVFTDQNRKTYSFILLQKSPPKTPRHIKMPKLRGFGLVNRKRAACEKIAGLNLTQHAYRIIIVDINALNEWDDDMRSNDMVRNFNKLFSSLADSCHETGISPFRSSSELFHKLFVIWAMQSDVNDIATLPNSICDWMIGRPWWKSALEEFLAMVRRQDVKIDWLDNVFQQFADEPPSSTNKRRQIAIVAPADQPRLLRRTLVSAPQAAEDTPSSRKVAKRKQDSQVVSDKSTQASSSSPAQPNKKITSDTPKPSSQLNVTSDTSSRGMDDNTSLRIPQHALGTSSSGALSTATFGLGLPNNFDTSNEALASQPGSNLVENPQTKPLSARDPTSSIDWHPEHIKVKKECDDLATQLRKANEQVKEKETRFSELHIQLSPLMDAAHGMLQGLNAVDLQREKMRDAAIKLLSHSSYSSQQAAASTSAGRGDAGSTTDNPEPRGQPLPENGSEGTRKNGRQGTN